MEVFCGKCGEKYSVDEREWYPGRICFKCRAAGGLHAQLQTEEAEAATSRTGDGAGSHPRHLERWEYRRATFDRSSRQERKGGEVVNIETIKVWNYLTQQWLEEAGSYEGILNALGNLGWELVDVDGHEHYFKRRKPSA